jgi:quercetin dioxygenase-like cupin family protein
MNIKLIGALFTVCLAANAAFAQDPTVVESKHYKLAFQNDKVQVVDVHYGPYEQSKMHDHPGGVVVYITEAHLKFIEQDGNVKEVYAKPGEARFFPPFKHRVENLADTPFDAVYIGLKMKSGGEKK